MDASSPFAIDTRSNWVRLRTLTLLRWTAIFGQITAITVAQRVLGFNLDLGLCYLAIGAAIIANLVSIFLYPESKRLNEREALLILIFDVAQLSVLLFLTGGLNNPFALLVLAPVTISATALRLNSVLIVGGLAIALITAMAFYHVPLLRSDGSVLELPAIFLFGSWAAITIGIVFEAGYARRVTNEIHSMGQALLATQMALAREQKLTDLGGVVAAAAHELGTPLATIKLVSSELREDLADQPELREDAELIHEQANRCRDILRSMGRAGKDDLHMRHAPLGTVVREAAEPHFDRGIDIKISLQADGALDPYQPAIARRPEIIHGLRNLVQNAVDFAESKVWIDVLWSETRIELRIIDDGAGFPPSVIGRIGDPFMRRRRNAEEFEKRPEYEGMGLGLFIAKTLLERSGAELSFANGSDYAGVSAQRSGAIVEVTWTRKDIEMDRQAAGQGLGQNVPIEV
jgi:two-component system sensor histidine kinase RegB